MKRKIIAIDIDDVIADSTEAMRLSVNESLGIDLQPEHYNIPADYWGYYEAVWNTHGLGGRITYAEHSARMIIDQSHVTLLPGAEFAIGELSKRFDIVLITARDLEWLDATKAWLEVNFKNAFKALHFAGNTIDKTAKTKGQQAVEIGASWLIDDNPEHCLTALAEGLEAILFGEYGWHHRAPKELARCKDWQVVLEYFEGVKDEI